MLKDLFKSLLVGNLKNKPAWVWGHNPVTTEPSVIWSLFMQEEDKEEKTSKQNKRQKWTITHSHFCPKQKEVLLKT